MNRNRSKKFTPTVRCNFDIKSNLIKLIDENGQMENGLIPLSQAIEQAQAIDLDVVEVNSASKYPICKLCDSNKFIYELKKKAKEHAKFIRSSVQETKIIQMHVGIEENDLNRKCNQAKKFLSKNDTVKFVVQMRGRENNNKQIAYDVINECIDLVSDVGMPDANPKLCGNIIEVLIKKCK